MPTYQPESTGGALTLIFFVLACIAGWITHVIWIITVLASTAGATLGQVALGFLGAFTFPVGIIHGWILWFQFLAGLPH